MCVRLCVFTSSSSMSACFTVTGSSWLIKSDIIVRLLRTTPSSAFSFFTWNINSTYWINTGTVTRWKEEEGKYWFYKGWKRKRIKKHSYKKEFCDSIVTNIEKPVGTEAQCNYNKSKSLSSPITWLWVKALFPSRASFRSEVWGGMSGLEDRSTAGRVVTAGPLPGKVW